MTLRHQIKSDICVGCTLLYSTRSTKITLHRKMSKANTVNNKESPALNTDNETLPWQIMISFVCGKFLVQEFI